VGGLAVHTARAAALDDVDDIDIASAPPHPPPSMSPTPARRIPRERRDDHRRGLPLALDPAAYELSPKAKALALGRRIAEQDLRAAGGAYDLAQVEDLLAISRQAIDRKVKDGALLAVPGPANRRRYPAVQFTRDGLLPGLKQVFGALGSDSPWYRLNWLVNPDPRLGGRTPAEVLAAGEVATAVAAARAQGHQGG